MRAMKSASPATSRSRAGPADARALAPPAIPGAERAIQAAQTADPTSLATKIRAVLDAYDTSDAAGRNALLKGVIDTVWYTKAKKTRPADFQLRVDLKPF